MSEVTILGAARTPMGGFQGEFEGVEASTLGGVAIALVILYGGRQVVDGTLEAGAFFAFVTALAFAYRPLKSVANLNS